MFWKYWSFFQKVSVFLRPNPNFTLNCHNLKCLKLITCLHLRLSHLREHSFQDSLKPYCTCGNSKIETYSHFLFHSSNLSDERLAPPE